MNKKFKSFHVLVTFMLAAGFSAQGGAAQHGNGIFGKWITDRFGMPAYEYTLDEFSDPRGEWDRIVAPKTRDMWFHIGNRRIVAAAYNHGFVQLFYNESGTKWINLYDRENLDFSGGFGFVMEGDKVFSTDYEHRPAGSDYRRIYGMGYFEKRIEHDALAVSQIVYAPCMDVSALVSEVTITNLSDRERSLSYFEYWDVNLFETFMLFKTPLRNLWVRPYSLQPEWVKSENMLIAKSNKVWGEDGGFPKKPRLYDPEQPSIFLAALSGEVSGFEFDQNRIFSKDKGWIAGPEPFKEMSFRQDTKKPKSNRDLCLVLRSDLSLDPGQKKTLRFAFGYAKDVEPATVIESVKGRADLLNITMQKMKEALPEFKSPPNDYLAREVKWNYYSLEALTLVDGYYKSPFVPQGGHYLYTDGLNGATRDFAAFAQTMAYYDPSLAKSQLKMMMQAQDKNGRLFYEMIGFGRKNLWIFRPSDLDLWLIWAATEYICATRDFSFLDEEVSYYPIDAGAKGTVYEHLLASLDHLINSVGKGKHGLIRLKLSDWNDEMTLLASRNKPIDTVATIYKGESTLNTAMACLILPMFAELAEAYGDTETSARTEQWADSLVPALKAQWREPGWLNRAYSGRGFEYGEKEFFLEPQVWALLAGNVLTPQQERILVDNIRSNLVEPSEIGMMISMSREGSFTTKPGEQEEGGVWYAINGPGIVALSRHDPALAYRELEKNSLTRHADTYPELWMGIWSGPDAFNSVYSDRPGETWCLIGSSGPQEYPVMNAHAHAQVLYALARLAGFNPTVKGYTIDPKIPLEEFSFRSKTASIERRKNSMKGSFNFEADGQTIIRISIPQEWRAHGLELRVNGVKIQPHVEEGFLIFSMQHEKGREAKWEITNLKK